MLLSLASFFRCSSALFQSGQSPSGSLPSNPLATEPGIPYTQSILSNKARAVQRKKVVQRIAIQYIVLILHWIASRQPGSPDSLDLP
ncbi:hypothetical protein VTN00DRAFT_10178 [Thermoascus crustaceus]|uniref:uncharacterized protein n=1 Tax=Thermoascus crustaceus TaxID=5088 RepID=UPI003742F6F6